MKLGWPEFIMVAVTMVTVIATVLVHYEGLSLIGRAIRGRALHHRAKILITIFAQLLLHIEVQTVSHPSRVHLDIETDDIEAEVRRLEALGARRVRAVHSWWVMEAPTGQRFCVVRAASARFALEANTWP